MTSPPGIPRTKLFFVVRGNITPLVFTPETSVPERKFRVEIVNSLSSESLYMNWRDSELKEKTIHTENYY